MRHSIHLAMGLIGLAALSACDKPDGDAVDRAFQDVNVVDENNLGDIMLTVADPNEAVSYFKRTSTEQPDRIDLRRGLARSLVRAGRETEAVGVWQKVVAYPEVTDQDRVDYADALIRTDQWEKAAETLDAVPPTFETYKRYRLEAMIADTEKNWEKADSFYQTAVGLTTRPAGVMNNWGYSKLTRGDYAEAERLFIDAIEHDRDLFTAKNNLVLARGAQQNYTLPVVPMDQVERAKLLHTLALSALKQGNLEIGKGLLNEAIETHPQHFETAVRSLRALENNVVN